MKRILCLTVSTVAICLMTTATFAQSDSLKLTIDAINSPAPIEGSWIFTITPAPGGPAPFSALASFAEGGVFVATGEDDRVNPVSELHGSWRRSASNRYGSTAYFFAFDPTGHAVGLLKTNQSFALTSQNRLVGLSNLSVCDLHGENCTLLPGVSQVTGKRVTVEDLPTL